MSGLLGGLLGMLTGAEKANAEGTHSALQDILGLNQPGGIGSLINQFTNGGMGQQVQSWVGNGSNLPITADQVQKVLSNDQVQALLSRTGLSAGVLLPLVAKLLPHAVDQATPNGVPPSS